MAASSEQKTQKLIEAASKTDAEEFESIAEFMIKTAEVCERYDEMCRWMLALIDFRVKSNKDLSEEMRNLFSVGYKNEVGSRRASFRVFQHGENKENDMIISYKELVKKEIMKICNEVLDVLQQKLIPNIRKLVSSDNEMTSAHKEARIFYTKMVGDYYRYLAEVDSELKNAKKADKYYTQGSNLAEDHLKPTHPIRLALALNHSVCYFEILKNQKKACEIAKKAFDEAIAQLDKLEESHYKDSTLVMQLLRDNVNLWTIRVEDEANGKEKVDEEK
mmetsp:Transcript_8957/g.14521  ORF Transcript_8957/g.14521 Transcript_8957/m.14521 type:complete len:276 (-) Transcript_8957:329-1156(-)